MRISLGIKALNDEKVIEAEVKLKRLFEQATEEMTEQNWKKLDELNVEMEALIEEFPQFRNKLDYVACNQYQIHSHWKRRNSP